MSASASTSGMVSRSVSGSGEMVGLERGERESESPGDDQRQRERERERELERERRPRALSPSSIDVLGTLLRYVYTSFHRPASYQTFQIPIIY